MKLTLFFLFLVFGPCSHAEQVGGAKLANVFSESAKNAYSESNAKNSFDLIPEWSERASPYSFFAGMSANRKEEVASLRKLFESLQQTFRNDFKAIMLNSSRRADSVSYFGCNIEVDGKIYNVTVFFILIDESRASLTFSVVGSPS